MPIPRINMCLSRAYNDYWQAKNPAVERRAYIRILFYGGYDGYPPTSSRWRAAAARFLRRLALWIEKR